MSSTLQSSSNELLDPVSDMGYSSEVKKCSAQPSKMMKEKIPQPPTSRSLKFQDKLKVENFVCEKYVDPHHASKQIPNKRVVIQPKHSENRQKQWVRSKAAKDDELVKHMSNVPGYLQRMDTGENVQEKALNFGVLSWENLEKWKHNQKPHLADPSIKSSSSSSSSSSKEKTISNKNSEAVTDICTSNGQELISPVDRSFGRKFCEQIHVKGKNKVLNETVVTEVETSSMNLLNYGVPGRSKAKVNSKACETVKRVEESQKSDTRGKLEEHDRADVRFNHQSSSEEHVNVARPFPIHVSKNNKLGVSQLSTPRTSIDSKYSGETSTIFSDGFSPQMVQPIELYSDIPHSCPLPFTVETSSLSNRKQNCINDAHCMDLSSVLDSSKVLDPVNTYLSDQKVRNPSPNRLFTMGIGRMSRSLSFKEGTAVPKLSSTYLSVRSGPVNSEASASREYSPGDKAHSTNRARSSPLRRLLDPLLKPKTPHRSAETIQSLKTKLDSSTNISESLHHEKNKASTVHALLQFSVKNGLPLFKFVVDNNSNILAATLTKSMSSSKEDRSESYTLYSVTEVKKKSGSWMNQGSKDKSSGYVYTIAGQMKVSTSNSHDLTDDEATQFTMKESVLFGVDLKHADQRLPKVVSNIDLASIVVKTPKEKPWSSTSGEDNKVCSSTVILPGAIHGMPIRGAPSPLLDRWRSGGSCDCGGWDLGCKLCVLSTHDTRSKSPHESKTGPNADRFELFAQVGAQENKPYFSIGPFKNNIYSVEFKASISLLQAFFICIAVKSGNRSFYNLELSSNSSEARNLQEQVVPQGESVPAKHTRYPPHSPVGRV